MTFIFFLLFSAFQKITNLILKRIQCNLSSVLVLEGEGDGGNHTKGKKEEKKFQRFNYSAQYRSDHLRHFFPKCPDFRADPPYVPMCSSLSTLPATQGEVESEIACHFTGV